MDPLTAADLAGLPLPAEPCYAAEPAWLSSRPPERPLEPAEDAAEPSAGEITPQLPPAVA